MALYADFPASLEQVFLHQPAPSLLWFHPPGCSQYMVIINVALELVLLWKQGVLAGRSLAVKMKELVS